MIKMDTKIVKVLLENKDKELTINQISKILKKDYKNVHTVVKRLTEESVLLLEPIGKSYRVKIINTLNPVLFEAEYQRREELLKNKDIAVMDDTFNSLRSKQYVRIIFGSYAKRLFNKQSDIDLMFIIPDLGFDEMEKEIESIARILPLKIHLNIFKESEFKDMNKSREITVGSEAIKNNIILYGIEAFYKMIG